MRIDTVFSAYDRDCHLGDLAATFTPDALVPGDGPWEVEIGFGKGRYLLQQALARPERRFLGIEVVSRYYRMLLGRGRRQGAENLLVVRGEAHYLLAAVLPRAFAEVVHVYFPDPWPKSRHHRRRLFDPATVDLVLGLLRPGGKLCFATDFLEYGELVRDLLRGFPHLRIEPLAEPWPGGARTNYEAKYMREGRPILRLRAYLDEDAPAGRRHPAGKAGILSGWSRRPDKDDSTAS